MSDLSVPWHANDFIMIVVYFSGLEVRVVEKRIFREPR
jgi:hypothetical protein